MLCVYDINIYIIYYLCNLKSKKKNIYTSVYCKTEQSDYMSRLLTRSTSDYESVLRVIRYNIRLRTVLILGTFILMYDCAQKNLNFYSTSQR